MRVIGLSVALALAATFVSTAQQQPPAQPAVQGPTFRVAVDYVEVDAVVTDAEGRFVRGLTKDDFEILEDGRPQSITAFSMVDIPAPPARAAVSAEHAVPPDVRSNEGDFNGRVVVLVLDDLLVDARRSLAVRSSAKQFINRFVGTNDLVAILTTSGSSSQDFTSNRAMLVAAIDRFMGRRLQSVAMAMAETYAATGTPVDNNALERASRSRDVLGRLNGAAGYLSGIRGRRKTLLWFTEGLDFDVDNPQSQHGASVRDAMTELIGTAQRAGVSFYGVDPRGIGGNLDDAIDIPALPINNMAGELGMRTAFNELQWTQGTMRTISAETGGFVVISGDLNEHFGRIVEANSSYYLLGYYPSSDKKDGKFRALDVRVKRPALRVQFRKGYAAPRNKSESRASGSAAAAPPELRAAIESPIPLGGVPFRAFAAAFRGPAKNPSVAVIIEFSPSGLRFQQQGEVFAETLDVLVVPLNSAGKALNGAHDEVPMKLSARTHELVRSQGFRIVRGLELPPGRYQLHIGARSANSKAVGALTYDLEVPDFSKPVLAMSGLAVMSTGADRMPTAPAGKDFTDVLPMAATALRDFERSDTLFFFTEVHPPRSGTPHAVEIATTLTSEAGAVVIRRTDQRRTDEITGKRGAFEHSGKLPLAGVAPGRYLLRVEARGLVSGGATVTRELEFRVR